MDDHKDLELLCEYLEAPLGIQNQAPRFSWRVCGKYENTFQQAYQVLVREDGGRIVWDSGRVASGKNSAVIYAGARLKSFGRYTWTVHVWLKDAAGEVCQMEGSSRFEMGILEQETWQGQWICAAGAEKQAAPLIRKEFSVDVLPQRARMYVCGLGYCEAWLNGVRIGDAFLDPGWTDYDRTVLYRTFDVTELLRTGPNVLAFELADGWYGNDHIAFRNMVGRQPPWLSVPKLLCNLYLDEVCIATAADGTWMCAEGPVLRSNVYDGETYDAGKEKSGYRMPSYEMEQGQWKPALPASPPKGVLRSQIMPPIRQCAEHAPVYIDQISEAPQCVIVIDFGVNFSGWVCLSAIGEAGKKIVMKYGETIDEKHMVNQSNLRYAKAEDTFVFGEAQTITYHPRFTYHGFRYVQIHMDPGVVLTEVKGCEIRTDIRQAGRFSCSNQTLNAIQAAVQQTEQNNLHSIPTDCPQRDERMGWMNDMTVRFEQALYNFDMLLFYEKWLQDIEDEQRADGAIPDTAPYLIGRMPARHPTSAYVLIPWYLYLFYDDTQILARHYEKMRQYVAFKLGQRNADGLLPETENGSLLPKKYMGDWAPPMTQAYLGYICNAVPGNVSQSLLTTSYLLYDCKVMEQIAVILQRQEDCRDYRQRQEELRKALNRCYLREDGFYDSDSQSANLFPLFLDYAPPEKRGAVLTRLLQDLEKRDNHVTTGNQMTKYLFEVLNQARRDDVAFQIAASETYPSLGFMLKNGATTIWERWEYLTNRAMNSHDHPMLGAYTSWFYKGLAGLQMSAFEPRTLVLCPAVIPGLDDVEASHDFINGRCSVKWEKHTDSILYTVTIPWNMTATVDFSHCNVDDFDILCDGIKCPPEELSRRRFPAGEHRFELRFGRNDGGEWA